MRNHQRKVFLRAVCEIVEKIFADAKWSRTFAVRLSGKPFLGVFFFLLFLTIFGRRKMSILL